MEPNECFDSLITPDERTVIFGPYGIGGPMPPELATRHQAATIARARLADVVPEGIRAYFDRVRHLHIHGVLEYEFFSAACDLSLFAVEAALRLRFMEFYDGRIPVIAKGRKASAGVPVSLACTFKGAHATRFVRTFDDVWVAARDWQLRSSRGPQPLPTALEGLLAWARHQGLLPGRRSRSVDRSLAALRNMAAHPSQYTLRMPPDSSRAIARAAEVINRLWGVDTPGGRLFPGPIRREPRVIGFDDRDGGATLLRLDQILSVGPAEAGYEFVVLLVPPEEELWNLFGGPPGGLVYRRGVQRTHYPCDELFRGSYDELLSCAADGVFDGVEDVADYLDRSFLVRYNETDVDDPRSPADVMALHEPLAGSWLAIVADSPVDARFHVVHHRERRLDVDGTCPECMVAVVRQLADWPSAVAWAQAQSPSRNA